jgi:hypothetical protein
MSIFDEEDGFISPIVALVEPVLLKAIEMGFDLITLMCLGRMGKGNLASGYMGLIYFGVVRATIEGTLAGVDNKVRVAAGQRQASRARYWTFVGLATGSFLCMIGTLIFSLSPLILYRVSGTNDHTIGKAVEFVIASVPMLWLTVLGNVVRRHQLVRRGSSMPLSDRCGFVGEETRLAAKALVVHAVLSSIIMLLTPLG